MLQIPHNKSEGNTAVMICHMGNCEMKELQFYQKTRIPMSVRLRYTWYNSFSVRRRRRRKIALKTLYIYNE